MPCTSNYARYHGYVNSFLFYFIILKQFAINLKTYGADNEVRQMGMRNCPLLIIEQRIGGMTMKISNPTVMLADEARNGVEEEARSGFLD